MAKVTKAVARYRKATTTNRCGNCRYMNDDGTCDKVVGIVKPTMVCSLYAREKAK